jgi:hypothetical protein
MTMRRGCHVSSVLKAMGADSDETSVTDDKSAEPSVEDAAIEPIIDIG